jgi:hypothetical protein
LLNNSLLTDRSIRLTVLLFILLIYIQRCMKYWVLPREKEIRHRVSTKVENVHNYYCEILKKYWLI